jgi:hypothetical protein
MGRGSQGLPRVPIGFPKGIQYMVWYSHFGVRKYSGHCNSGSRWIDGL